jgi:hypothetical protein
MTTAESDLLFIDCRRLSLLHHCVRVPPSADSQYAPIVARKNVSLAQKLNSHPSARHGKSCFLTFPPKPEKQQVPLYHSVQPPGACRLLVRRPKRHVRGAWKLRDEGALKFHKNEFELL